MFTIYQRPSDYPDHYVVRKWFSGPGEARPDATVRLASSLEEARGMVPCECVRLERHQDDDAVIVETWI